MTEFERELVNSFNEYFQNNSTRGIAYRLKQHRFTSQVVDILVDSLHPDFYLGIECKSISTDKGATALYFTQHFSTDKDGVHQAERMTQFLRDSGRKGLLAIELRRGIGRPRKAYIIPWDQVLDRFKNDEVGFQVDEIQEYPEITREGEHYTVDPSTWRKQKDYE